MIQMKGVRMLIRWCFLPTLSLAGLSCDKESHQILPQVPVRITIQLDLPQYSDLRVPGNVVQVPRSGFGGNGVYVVHELIAPNSYSAYDATCPRHLETPVATILTGVTAHCAKCKTAYLLINGGLSEDGNFRLQPYRTHTENALLYIFNGQ